MKRVIATAIIGLLLTAPTVLAGKHEHDGETKPQCIERCEKKAGGDETKKSKCPNKCKDKPSASS